MDLIRIYVLWDPDSDAGATLAEKISSHFDGLGMERDGVVFRVPVRFRSAAWGTGSGLPREIDLGLAKHNAIVFLHDLHSDGNSVRWDEYVLDVRKAMDARGNVDWYLPFGSPTGESALLSDSRRHTQYAQRERWAATLTSELEKTNRLLLHIVFAIRTNLRRLYFSGRPDELLFVSHAKADGDSSARAIVDFVNSTDQDVPLDTFYDAKELSPGDDFEAKFEDTISNGTLLAIVSDVYDSRPWCVFELTTAKRARRPIVLADVGAVRTSRTFPYGSNLPKIRVVTDPHTKTWIEPLVVQALSEGLRCDLFALQADLELTVLGISGAVILPRPPELFDLVATGLIPTLMIYPDPPLGAMESELLQRAINLSGGAAKFLTLGECHDLK